MSAGRIISVSKYGGEDYDKNASIREVVVGRRPALTNSKDKVILLLGPNEAHNGFLIDIFCNYVYNVEFNSKSRFNIVGDGSDQNKKDCILTKYNFNQTQLPYRPIFMDINLSNNKQLSVSQIIDTILEYNIPLTNICIVVDTYGSNKYDSFYEQVAAKLRQMGEDSIRNHVSLLMMVVKTSNAFDPHKLPPQLNEFQFLKDKQYHLYAEGIYNKFNQIDDKTAIEKPNVMWSKTMKAISVLLNHLTNLPDIGDDLKVEKKQPTSILSTAHSSVNVSVNASIDGLDSGNSDKQMLVDSNKESFGGSDKESFGGSNKESFGDSNKESFGDSNKESFGDSNKESLTVSNKATLPDPNIHLLADTNNFKVTRSSLSLNGHQCEEAECFGEIPLSPLKECTIHETDIYFHETITNQHKPIHSAKLPHVPSLPPRPSTYHHSQISVNNNQDPIRIKQDPNKINNNQISPNRPAIVEENPIPLVILSSPRSNTPASNVSEKSTSRPYLRDSATASIKSIPEINSPGFNETHYNGATIPILDRTRQIIKTRTPTPPPIPPHIRKPSKAESEEFIIDPKGSLNVSEQTPLHEIVHFDDSSRKRTADWCDILFYLLAPAFIVIVLVIIIVIYFVLA